jgi:hypothetical protein
MPYRAMTLCCIFDLHFRLLPQVDFAERDKKSEVVLEKTWRREIPTALV